MSTLIFSTLFILGLCSFPLLASAQSNFFIFPPAAGPAGVTVTESDSHQTFEVGETIDLEWATNSTSLLSLIAFQGPRDPESGFYNLTLIDRAPAPVPTSYAWTVGSLYGNGPDFRLEPIHFLIWSWGDGIGFNSKYVRITAAGGGSPTSSGSSSAPGITSSDSPLSSPAPSSSDGKSGYKIGLGVGIPMALVIGGIACFLILRRRRNHQRAAQSTPDTQTQTQTPEADGKEVTLVANEIREAGREEGPVQHEADGVPRHEMP